MLFRKSVASALMFLFSTTVYSSSLGEMSVDFEDVAVGKLPKSWIVSSTNSNKNLATWGVEEEKGLSKGKKILSLQKINDSFFIFGSVFNLCYTKDVNLKNLEVSVLFRANSGKVDQGGGIMWRVLDRNNYYVARFNPLEDNFRFYSVINGKRDELESADVKLSKGWHEMKIIQNGSHFQGYIDGKKLLDTKDNSIKHSGGVGVWTKADAATSFDNFLLKSLE